MIMDRRKPVTKSNSRIRAAVDVRVGARVKSRRTQLGLSQSDLGDALGITFQQIQKYEKGFNRISSSRLQQIANLLRVQPAYFFEDDLAAMGAQSHGLDPETFNRFVSSRDGVALMQAFAKIKSKELRRSIANMVAQLQN